MGKWSFFSRGRPLRLALSSATISSKFAAAKAAVCCSHDDGCCGLVGVGGGGKVRGRGWWGKEGIYFRTSARDARAATQTPRANGTHSLTLLTHAPTATVWRNDEACKWLVGNVRPLWRVTALPVSTVRHGDRGLLLSVCFAYFPLFILLIFF